MWFEFDANAFTDEDFSAAVPERSPRTDVMPQTYEEAQPPQVSEPQYEEDREKAEKPQSSHSEYEGDAVYEVDEGDVDFKLLGSGSGDTCLEDAYSRFVGNLEKVHPSLSTMYYASELGISP